LPKLAKNVKNDYDIKTTHKEILMNFDDAEGNAFIESFGRDMSNIQRGCPVHFIRSAMQIAKQFNSSISSPGYNIFMSIVKRIPDEPTQQIFDTAFNVLCGLESFQIFRDKLPPDLRKYDDTQVDTSR